MRSYKQLTHAQRYQIDALNRAGHSQSRIAEVISVHRSTVCREMSRNHARRGYLPRHAHLLALSRRRNKVKSRLHEHHWATVVHLMKLDWSPEQIAGRLLHEGGFQISHEWIYQYVMADKERGGNLYCYLRCQKQHRKRYGKNHRMRGGIRDRVSIDQRPMIVDQRRRMGDWEADTLAGRAWSTRVLTMVERKSRYTILGALANKSAQQTAQALVRCLRQHKGSVHTLTVDNGQEFAAHRQVTAQLGTPIYFSDYYAAWQRGTVENTNGLLRQYLPKSKDFNALSRAELNYAQAQLNHRPRKCLGYRTPYEVFHSTRSKLTLH